MENIYAALLLHKAGKEVNEENLKSVVKAAGVDVSSETETKIKSLIASLKDVDIDKELESASVAAPVASSSGGEGKEEQKEEKKEEKTEEEKEAAAGEGLSALFG